MFLPRHIRFLYLPLLLSFLIPTPSSAAFAERPQTKSPSLFPDDTRLQRKITLQETGVTVEEILRRLSQKEFFLTCDKHSAQQKLQIQLKNRPLRVFMQALAELLPGTWRPREDKDGYQWEMSATAVRDRDEWWRLYLETRNEALQTVSQALVSSMRAAPPSPERAKELMGGNAEVMDPRDEQEFFNQLSPDLQGKLAQQIDDTPLYDGRGLNAFDEEGAYVVKVSDLPPGAQAVLRRRDPNLPANTIASFLNDVWSIQVNFTSPDGRFVVGTMEARVTQSPDINITATYLLGLNHSTLGQLSTKQLEGYPASWKKLAAYRRKTFWTNKLPTDVPRRIPPPRRVEVLNWIGEQAKIEFVADYYSQPGIPLFPQQKEQPLSGSLEEELNRRAVEYDMSWKKQGDLYLFRNNRWYRDDALEAPAELAKQWLTVWKTRRPPEAGPIQPSAEILLRDSMDWKSAFAANLTRWQLANGLRWLAQEETEQTPKPQPVEASERPSARNPFAIYPFHQLSQQAHREYSLLRFYANLTPEARTALCEKRLPLSSLSPSQQQQALWLAPTLRFLLEAKTQQPVFLGLGAKGDFGGKTGLVFATSSAGNQ